MLLTLEELKAEEKRRKAEEKQRRQEEKQRQKEEKLKAKALARRQKEREKEAKRLGIDVKDLPLAEDELDPAPEPGPEATEASGDTDEESTTVGSAVLSAEEEEVRCFGLNFRTPNFRMISNTSGAPVFNPGRRRRSPNQTHLRKIRILPKSRLRVTARGPTRMLTRRRRRRRRWRRKIQRWRWCGRTGRNCSSWCGTEATALRSSCCCTKLALPQTR
eukprot:SAG31_NODE_196_length_20699_cov_103.813835_7_plen_218_part_00